MSIARWLFPSGADAGSGRATLARFAPSLRSVQATMEELAAWPDSRLREQAATLRGQAAPDVAGSVALAAEAVRRAHGISAYDVQIIAALALSSQKVIEMATGEGKTLVAFLAGLRYAIEGHGAHVATVNPYLAERDHEFASAPARLLGLTAGLLPEGAPSQEKIAAYACDLTYGVGSEFGFDYLRDQLTLRALGRTTPRVDEILRGVAPPPPKLTQRGQPYAIIDEADSVLIDEARSPLVIAGGAQGPHPFPQLIELATRTVAEMKNGVHFRIPHDTRHVELTEAGMELAFFRLTDEIAPMLQRVWPEYITAAVRARFLFHRDVHYVVKDRKVVIVDEFTGRLCPERKWREGLHQAIESFAGVPISSENTTEATISRPRYFQLYRGFCGLTGTVQEVSRELAATYRLSTTVIPLHRPSRREVLPDRVFRTRAAKLAAATEEVARRRALGQPVLVGSRTIEGSEAMAAALEARGIPCTLLNGKQDASEAAIIAQAGEPARVTIATNMAGRGAHIPVPAASLEAGGLHVMGLERHEAGRIDRQLIGRAARQGQPGSAQFFLSLEDPLLREQAPAVARRLAERFAQVEELPADTAKHFLRLQRQIELHDQETRRLLAREDETIDDLKQAL